LFIEFFLCVFYKSKKSGLGTNVNTAGKKGAGKPEEPGSGGAKHCQKSCGSEWATDQKKVSNKN